MKTRSLLRDSMGLLVASLLMFGLAPAKAQVLDLASAERLALDGDPAVREIRSRAGALRDRAVSASQLPDPTLRFGAVAVPLDTFDLDQEPMTQLQLGVQQRFLPGDTLELQGRQLMVRADAWEQRGADQALLSLRSVREDYLEVRYFETAGGIIDQARGVLEDLLEATKDYYATGRTRQQDVLRAELELSRIEERALRNEQAEEMARARLALWVGDSAYGGLDSQWPVFAVPGTLTSVIEGLEQHPRFLALEESVQAAELGIDVAREQYKPGWMLDFTYGNRSGRDVDGDSRPDLLSAMVTVDLPVFRSKRQDQDLSASIKQLDSMEAARQDAYRQLRRSAEREWAALGRIDDRLDLFRDHLLPEAAANSEASVAAYQSGVGDFTALMRARITEFELQLDEARARADRLIVQARLLYLMGETP